MAGTYDLALGRSSHDMIFEAVSNNGSTEQRYSIKPIDGSDRVAQQIKMTLLTFLGEWFLDINWGVPYLEDVLIKNPRMSSVESILRSRIKAVPDVDKIVSFSMEFNRRYRTLKVSFEADTLLGPVKDSVSLNLLQRA